MSTMIILNSSNYQSWKTRMEDHLYVNGLHQPIISSDKPSGFSHGEWNLLNRRVCGHIRQWVDDSVLSHVSGEINAHTLWSKLGKLYAPKTCDSKLLLIKQLMGLRYHAGIAMSDHLNTFQGIINQLSETGIKIDEEVQGLFLLGTLPDSWETLKTSLSNLTPDEVISMQLAKSIVLNEEMENIIVKVSLDKNLHEQIGKDIVFDLVDHDKVHSFCIQKHLSFFLFKEEVAKEFGISAQFQRFWVWIKGENQTYRPYRPLTPQEEALPVGLLRGVNEDDNDEVKLFLEVNYGPGSWLLPPPAITKKDILLFFKLYDPLKEELRADVHLLAELQSKTSEKRQGKKR